MNNYLKQVCSFSIGFTTLCFSFLPEEVFSKFQLCSCLSINENITVNRILFLLAVGFVTGIILFIYRKNREKVTIHGNNYKIIVEYGDIFNQREAKKVINFDECYTTDMGDAAHQIKPKSLCGQFLQKHPVDILALLTKYSLTPARKHSQYDKKTCYTSGSLLPYGEFLLMAFGKLDTNGRSAMSREDYLSCLNTLWKEIDKYYAATDVAIPVLGAGLTRFKGEMLSQQQLVDMIIYSYKLNPYKIKSPNTLHIICRETKDFSLNKVGETL